LGLFKNTNHWHECLCGDKINLAIHTSGDWITTTPTTHTTVGSKHKECTICGYVILSETILVLPADPNNNTTSNNSSNLGNNNTTSNNTTDLGNNNMDNNITKPVDKSSSNNDNKNKNKNKGNIANPSRNTPTYYSNHILQDSYTNDSNNTTEEKNIIQLMIQLILVQRT